MKTFIYLYLACIEEGVGVSPHNDVNVWDRLRHFDIWTLQHAQRTTKGKNTRFPCCPMIWVSSPTSEFRDGILKRHFLSRFLGINLSLVRFEFLSGFFCPSFSRSTKCYSWIDLSFLVFADFLQGFLNQRRVWFSFARSKRLESFVKLMSKKSIWGQTCTRPFYAWSRKTRGGGALLRVMIDIERWLNYFIILLIGGNHICAKAYSIVILYNDMVWLCRSPIPVGRKRVFYLFWFLISTCLRGA